MKPRIVQTEMLRSASLIVARFTYQVIYFAKQKYRVKDLEVLFCVLFRCFLKDSECVTSGIYLNKSSSVMHF